MSRSPQQVYRIAASYRRCCWYVMIGFAGIAPVGIWVAQNVQNVPFDRAVTLASAYLLVIVAAMFPLTWSLRVEEEGIRRRWLGLADFWSWDDFASGRLVKRHPITIVDPRRPLWRRRLRLDWMSGDDTRHMIGLINAHYLLPPPPIVPNPLVLNYHFRRSATFDDKGIHLVVRGVPKEYLWTDVVEVHIIRMDPVRRDFSRLRLKLPDEVLELWFATHQGGTSPTWRGATAEEINEMLFGRLPEDRLHVSIAGEQIKDREYIEKALREAAASRRSIGWLIVVFVILAVGFMLYTALAGKWEAVLAVSIFCLLGYGPMLAGFYIHVKKSVQRLASQLAALDEAESQ